MRLDKFISQLGYTRKDAERFIKLNKVTVNNKIVLKKDYKIDENKDIICIDGNVCKYSKYVYIMLNKPEGILSATEDKTQQTVLSLLPPLLQNKGLFPVGRLDKETMGLLILTNDGEFCHKMISPKNKIEKIYKFKLADDILSEDVLKIEQGIMLKDGYTTLPCTINMTTLNSGQITIVEGKYHQIRRMFGAVCNKVIYLERIKEGEIYLDCNLSRGQWREFNQLELQYCIKNNLINK